MENDPFIDGLPSYKMVIFHGYVSHNQMVSRFAVKNINSTYRLPIQAWGCLKQQIYNCQ